MKIYFDQIEKPNLSHLMLDESGHPHLVHNHFPKHILEFCNFSIRYNRDYDKGVYLVSIRQHSPFWSGNTSYGPKRHVLYEIPMDVIEAAKKRKIIIILNSEAEGFPLQNQDCDGYKELHLVMQNLGLPQYSVIFIDGNFGFTDHYHSWCLESDLMPMVKHVSFFTHLFYFRNKPSQPLVLDAIGNGSSASFSSLNRTMRNHRLEHICMLLRLGLHKDNLVSGYVSNSNNIRADLLPIPVFNNITKKEMANILIDNLPLTIDGDWGNMHGPSPDQTDDTLFNFKIYKSSLLSFVTETAFHQPGMFLTEKIFKPIAAGHPFMVLGQYNLLKTLRDWGYRTDFSGIDQSYDEIKDPIDRFHAAHDSLKKWVEMPRLEKISHIEKSIPAIKYNMAIFNSVNYEFESYNRLKTTAEEIFRKFP